MTVQFNLLPDIKVRYLKVKRQQHLVVLVSIVACLAAVVIFLMSLSVVYGVQKKSLNDLNKDIKTSSNKLESTKDLTKVLTVQNQLKSLPSLHDSKVVSSRLYDYLTQVTPADATITKLDADFTLNTMLIAGESKDLETVNKFVDTLKFTKYTVGSQKEEHSAFSAVVLASFSRDSKTATYNISLNFDPVVFNGTQSVKLTVPQVISTRSEVDKPTALFQDTTGGQ